MNPKVGIGIPRSDFCRGLAIGVVAFSPTNRDSHTIGKCHRETLVHMVRDQVETGDRIGDGVGVVAHGDIIPKVWACVKSSFCSTAHRHGSFGKRHTLNAGMAYSYQEQMPHHIAHKFVQRMILPL